MQNESTMPVYFVIVHLWDLTVSLKVHSGVIKFLHLKTAPFAFPDKRAPDSNPGCIRPGRRLIMIHSL